MENTTMHRTVAVLALLAVTAGAFAPLAAQGRRDRGIVELGAPATRGGFFITGGLGAGAEQYKFDGDAGFSDKLTKPTVMLRLGGTPNANVRVGAEFFGWGSDEPDGFESFGTALLAFQFFPIKDQGLFFKAAGGVASSQVEFNNGATTTETGFGWSLGAGYDIQLSRSFGLGPSIDLYQGSFTSRNEPTLTERVLNIGVQLTFQTGGRSR
jgi:hypothetical protein